MSSWRSSGSKISGFCVASLILLFLIPDSFGRSGEVGEESHGGATISIKVSLIGVTSYNDFLEIKTGLLKSEGVEKVTIDSEAPGVIGLSVRYAGEPKSLIEKLAAFFPTKYRMTEKRLPRGGTEINIATR